MRGFSPDAPEPGQQAGAGLLGSSRVAQANEANESDDWLELVPGPLAVPYGKADAEHPPHDLMAALALAFARTIADPANLGGDALPGGGAGKPPRGGGVARGPSAASAPAPEDTLEDMVSGVMAIDQVLGLLGPEVVATKVAPFPENDVLRLFGDAPGATGGMLPPELTRREHHATGLDSPTGGGATSP